MKLLASPFTDLRLEKAFHEKRPDEAIKDVDVFVYNATRHGIPVRVVLESSPTVSDRGKTLPQSFHFMSVERIRK